MKLGHIATIIFGLVGIGIVAKNSLQNTDAINLTTSNSESIGSKNHIDDIAKPLVKQTLDSNVSKCKIGNDERLVQKLISPLATDQKKINKALSIAFENPVSIIQNAKNGDEDSAVALFTLVSSCFPFEINQTDSNTSESLLKSKNSSCPEIPISLVNDRLDILEPSAKRGSATAQLKYAMNASYFATYYFSGNNNESVKKAKELLEKAEQYGVQASKSGALEAFEFMSRSYQIGTFGSRNPSLAYAYMLPVAKYKKSNEFNVILNSLKKNLSSEEIKHSEEVAWGCKEENVPPTNVLNPFK